MDLKVFAALKVHGTTAVTCVTAQNPAGVRSVQAIRPAVVRDQLEAVLDAFQPAAVKTGMLYSAEIIRAVAETLRGKKIPLIVDPVMIATSGAVLLKPNAVRALTRDLLPLAEIVTPNLDEAEFLLGRKLRSPEDLRAAARQLHERFGCAALVKGGHLRGTATAIDFFFDGCAELLLEAPRIQGVSTHGTGCTYSAALAAHRALGLPLLQAAPAAKQFISNAIAQSVRSGHHQVLNCFWRNSGG